MAKKKFTKLFFAAVLTFMVSGSLAQWLPNKALQTGRARMAVATAGSKVYFAGGYDGSSVQNKIDVYDDATGELTAYSRTLTVGRADLVGVYNANRNKIYFAGGQTNGSKSSVIEVLNLTTNNWDTQLALPIPIAYMCAASYGDKILFAGGSNGSNYYDQIYVYNTLTGGPPATYPLSEGRDQIAITMIGSKVIMAGGHKGGGVYSDNIDIFDLAAEEVVSHGYTLSEARAFLAAATLDSKAYFGGGQKGSPNVASKVVDIIDLNASPGSITPLELSEARYYLAAAATPTKVIFGGGGVGSTPNDDVDVFGTAGSNSPSQLSVARVTLAAASVGTKVLFAGGIASGNNYSTIVNIYDTETTKPLVTTLNPTDGASNVPYASDLVITFNEKVKAGTGNIIIKRDGVVVSTFPASDASVNINNATVTITLPNLKSESEFTVEMAAGVFKDLAGNDFDGFVGAGIWDFDTETLVTVTNQTYIDVFEKGGANQDVSFTVNNQANVKPGTVKFLSRGISDDPAVMATSTTTLTDNTFKFSLSSSNFTDAIGLYYYFEYEDLSGRVETTDKKRTYIKYTSETSEAIPGLEHGNSMDNYQIISIPLELENKSVASVFSDLGDYNPKLWRLYDYSNNDNHEQPTSINTGQGYWLIKLENTSISPGAGTTAKFSNEGNDEPFEIDLKPGWNLIGNPYNFAISWTDIVNANTNHQASLTDDVGVYNNGDELTYGGIRINAYRGAFVENIGSAEISIRIPVRRNNNIPGGRVRSEPVDLQSYNWSLPINVSDGAMTNATGGIGMNKAATLTGRDRYDRLPIPMPVDMFGFSIAHPEINKNFVRDIVPSSDSHVWDLEIDKTSDKPLKLTWDNTLITETEMNLYLVDIAFGVVKDMKAEGSYTIPSSTNSLKVVFGKSEFVREAIEEIMPLAGYPYPNPAVDEVRIPFHVPSKVGKLNVSIEVISAQGSKVATLANGSYESGSHEVIWNTSGKSGLYLVQMKIGTEKPTWAKVVVE